jgi:ectoine hydroxylase-related dioxygenase (phytanoyl-CoA dioxygenase family)
VALTPHALHTPYRLSADAIAAFQRDGHVCLRGLASREEVAAFRDVIERATLAHRYDKRPLAERDTYGRAFMQATNLWRRDPAIAPFTLSKRFARVAAELMAVDGVRLYHDQALYKEPGGGYTPWHQDQTYWPLATPHTITMWMPLVDIPAEVGSMRFLSGTHRAGDLGKAGIGDDSQQYFEALRHERGYPVVSYGALAAGDATFHAGWTVHGADANPTPLLRAVMTVIYFAAGARVAEPANEAQRVDRRIWLDDIAPGAAAAGPKNPLLWQRD